MVEFKVALTDKISNRSVVLGLVDAAFRACVDEFMLETFLTEQGTHETPVFRMDLVH